MIGARTNMSRESAKSNKNGSMLIVVLMIMAVGLILITSAMMITGSTRQRYFDSSKSNQARLTVTSVAEAFYQAVYLQEITDEQLEALANGNAVLDFSVNGTSVPGASGAVGNMTKASFSKTGTDLVTIVFSTEIDGKQENIRMVLRGDPPDEDNSLFQTTVQLGDGGALGQMNVGQNPLPGARDNIALLLGDSHMGNTGSSVYSCEVVCTGILTTGSGNAFHNNVILYGPDAGFDVNGSDGAGLAITGGSLFFLSEDGDGTGDAFYNGGSVISGDFTEGNPIDADSIATYNFNFNAIGSISNQSLNGFYSDPNSFILQRGSYSNPATITTEASSRIVTSASSTMQQQISARIDEYLSGIVATAVTNGFPSSATVAASFGDPYSHSTASELELTNTSDVSPDPGGYIISGNSLGNPQASGGDTPGVTIDLAAGNYTFYVDHDFTIANGYFNVINATGSDNWVRFILAPNVHFTIGTNSNDCGIISSGRAAGAAPTSGTKPHVYIFGAQGNTVTLGPQTTIDAYIGVYGDTSNPGIVEFCNSTNFYGRISATTMMYRDGAQAIIPYCPGPTYDETNGNISIRYSNYIVEEYEYFY